MSYLYQVQRRTMDCLLGMFEHNYTRAQAEYREVTNLSSELQLQAMQLERQIDAARRVNKKLATCKDTTQRIEIKQILQRMQSLDELQGKREEVVAACSSLHPRLQRIRAAADEYRAAKKILDRYAAIQGEPISLVPVATVRFTSKFPERLDLYYGGNGRPRSHGHVTIDVSGIVVYHRHPVL
jgi:prefoldin subunit 5